MAFDLIYTGRERGVNLPTGERVNKAEESLSDFITKAETLKYQTFRANESEFLKTSNIDPAFFISKASQDHQFQLLDTFNKRWSGEYKKYQGNLPMEAKQQMIAEKNFIISEQQRAQASEQRWKEHDALVKQNPLRYDRAKQAVNTDNFFKSGDYQNTTPPLKSKDFSMFLKDQSNKFNKAKISYSSAKDEYGRIVDQFTNIDDKDIPSFIESNLFADDQAFQGLTEEFLADQSPEKMALLTDTNKDGRITNEDADENVIIAWAKKNPKYINAVRQIETTSRNANKSASTTPNKGTPVKVAGATVNIFPGEKVGVRTYGGKVYSANAYGFGGNTPLYGIPTAGATLLTGKWADEVDPGSVNARLVLYDPDKRVFLIETTSGSESAMTASKVLLEVPESSITNSENIPLNDNGKQTTVGAVRGTKSTKGLLD
jgi:hypothetical protein